MKAADIDFDNIEVPNEKAPIGGVVYELIQGDESYIDRAKSLIARLKSRIEHKENIVCPCRCRDASIFYEIGSEFYESGELWMNWDVLKILFYTRDEEGAVPSIGSSGQVNVRAYDCPICGLPLPTNHRDKKTNGMTVI